MLRLALSDVLATGSNDGYLRFWKRLSGIKPLDAIPLHGFINGWYRNGSRRKVCVAAVGQPLMGRWDRVPREKNRLQLFVCMVMGIKLKS